MKFSDILSQAGKIRLQVILSTLTVLNWTAMKPTAFAFYVRTLNNSV